jgi:DNA-binding NarL/FixJ family response regulator
MSDAKVRIVVADGHPIIREGLRTALERHGLYEVVAEAEDGYAATLVANAQKPDVIILDSGLRKLECYDVVTRIRAQSPTTRILVTFISHEAFEIQALIEAGVSGFVNKTAMPQEFHNAVQALMGDGTYFSGSLATHLYARRNTRQMLHNSFGLTNRETEVLRFICSGFSNKDVARRFQLSVRTVETHRLNIRKKTGAARLRDLVHVARQLDLVDTEPRSALVIPLQGSA